MRAARMFTRSWKDEAGFVISTELILIGTVAADAGRRTGRDLGSHVARRDTGVASRR
jgi:hypothetical protein